MRRLARRAGAAFAALALVCAGPAVAAQLDYELAPRKLAEGVYVFEGAVEDFSPRNGCNIINTGFIVTGAGVVVINTGPSRLYGEQQRAAIARVTREPVVRVLNLNLHPDYFFGNQAYADVPIEALPGTTAGMKREMGAYADNLYRLCGDWMKGTEPRPPTVNAAPGVLRVGTRELELTRLSGHTSDDLVVLDRASGVLFAGGLVFVDRTVTTPHAELPDWFAALDALAAMRFRTMVPSHGKVIDGARGIAQTRDYLRWLDRTLEAAARSGQDLNEVLATPIPAEFSGLGAIDTEFLRNVTHLYPRYEQRVLTSGRSVRP
jgi:quinoprotein relay system zinc metallohydrolase 1